MRHGHVVEVPATLGVEQMPEQSALLAPVPTVPGGGVTVGEGVGVGVAVVVVVGDGVAVLLTVGVGVGVGDVDICTVKDIACA